MCFPRLYWGMLAQNHRGHHSHGFATCGDGIESYTNLGLIPTEKAPGKESPARVSAASTSPSGSGPCGSCRRPWLCRGPT
ncbi:MAG TPA: hypothetical protein VMW03_05125 [Candidatus Krumholzibacteriaceae bacterium]|nr:hypothetical protein [Candidatus Krumholzibacteriaceae bacterium]